MKQPVSAEEQSLPSESLQKFLALLSLSSGKRIENARLWEYFQDAFPYRPGGTENRRWLHLALLAAVDQELIRLPSSQGRCWDTTLDPPLPTLVWKIQRGRILREERWRNYPWLPPLQWVAQLPALSQEYEDLLKRVQQALREGTFRRQAPLKYRSLQLTGDEKRLGDLLHTALFRPGRLSLELLGCMPDIPPLVLETIGEGRVALVFENATLFRIASQLLKQCPHIPYGLLGYGSGAVFERSVLHFQWVEHPVTRIEYLGDLDRPGLRIARGAALQAQLANLPPVVPAQRLHRAMLASIRHFGYPGGLEYQKKEQGSHPSDVELTAWLPEDVRAECITIIQAGRRIPEEVLGPDELYQVWQAAFSC